MSEAEKLKEAIRWARETEAGAGSFLNLLADAAEKHIATLPPEPKVFERGVWHDISLIINSGVTVADLWVVTPAGKYRVADAHWDRARNCWVHDDRGCDNPVIWPGYEDVKRITQFMLPIEPEPRS